jgi:NAD(P)-dependent dehydrogenase (short-subunit alcohol dehydrogenase family)
VTPTGTASDPAPDAPPVQDSAARPAAVVTGAARGLGRAIATRLAETGHLVVGLDMDRDEVTAAMTSLPGEGHRAVAGDAGNLDMLTEAFAAIPPEANLRTFVANAGIARPGASVDFPMQSWDDLHAVLLRAVFLGAREAARRMSAGSSIVMISSINGTLGFGGRAAYAAAKAGVQGLVRSLAVEWAERGIRVNAVAPGTVSTEMQQAFMRTGYASPERFLRHVPMNRFGVPAEVADAVEFLASPRASYITGVILPVDGGWAAFGMAADD